jgi:hypothetical protein
VKVGSHHLSSSFAKVNVMVLGHNDNFELLTPFPTNNEAFGYVAIARCIGCTAAT